MAMAHVGDIAAYRQTHSPRRLAWSEGWQPSGAGLRSSNELVNSCSDLCHDDSTINIVHVLLFIIIIIIIELLPYFPKKS